MVGGYGGGSAIFGTLASGYLVPSFGWRATFQILGGVFFVMTMIGTALLKNPPAGYVAAGARGVSRTTATSVNFTTRETLKTPTFYALWVAFCFGTTAGQMTISQLVPFTRAAGLGATVATLSLVVTSFGNAGGRIFSGWLSDAIGRVRTLQIMVFLSALAMPALFLGRTQVATFYLFVALVYWCYGTQISVVATTMADFYGTKNFGLNYGVLFTAWGASGILGPAIAGRVFDRTGDYRYAFFAASVFALIALTALFFAKTPTQGQSTVSVSVSASA